MSKVVLRQIARFNALKFASSILFNADTSELTEDYERDADTDLLDTFLREELQKISNQLSKKADDMKQSSVMPNMVERLECPTIENPVDIERDYG